MATEVSKARREPPAVELMNTVWADRDGVHDALATAGQATSWLAAVRNHLPDISSPGPRSATRLTSAEAGQLRRLRDALRALAAEVTDDPRPDRAAAERFATPHGAVAVVNAAAGAVSAPTLRRHGGTWVAGQSAPSALAAVLGGFAADAVALFGGKHDAGPLYPCLGPGCVLYFTRDHPRREWCSDACGNRARVARHYARARQTS